MEPKLSHETVLEFSKLEDKGSASSTYIVEFIVDSDFGVPGAVTAVNNYDNEFFLETINIKEKGNICFSCKSWIQPNKLDPHKRIFFINKVYLPCETPNGLKEFRGRELKQMRGGDDGSENGQLRPWNRIYDYDVYNDLGDPDKGNDYARPTLGGQHNPHPTRCRTGRPPTKSDAKAESRPSESELIYVPRDEEYEDIKQQYINQGKLKAVLRNIVPGLRYKIMGSEVISNIDRFIQEPTEHSVPKSLLNLGVAMGQFFKFDPPKLFSSK
ncbi:linoleate 13s-lipoxygenase 3-1 chloroplastic-like [Trifolium pratense]|uniref:Linoleate 13s-lipoxygenase 3-1 chloroplastic-like n=1 Tax=Trifolium pratense TaxID=57577 RepID=A0A2K3MJA9_TRIPR|nr:linoleate 13s-lipoxygenase 3-1 chloroplastic-like [Trifolium pratense]